MNRFQGEGRIVRDAVINGVNNKALSFTIATGVGYDKDLKKDRYAFVPCVLFNPEEDIMERLLEEETEVTT